MAISSDQKQFLCSMCTSAGRETNRNPCEFSIEMYAEDAGILKT